MKKVILPKNRCVTEVDLDNVPAMTPVFAKKNGKLNGMLVHEDKGWIVRVGGYYGSDGYHKTREEAIESSQNYGLEFFIED